MVFLDLRIEKTERAIKKAFIELRAHKPLEKIRVKELCELALINKSTFYSHYQDVFALSNAMEAELFEAVLSDLPDLRSIDVSTRADCLTQELFKAFVKNQDAVNVLFSGSRQGVFINGIEAALREHIAQNDPDYLNDPVRGILLSFCVQGCYYAFVNNSAQMDQKRLVSMLAAMARAAQNCVVDGK